MYQGDYYRRQCDRHLQIQGVQHPHVSRHTGHASHRREVQWEHEAVDGVTLSHETEENDAQEVVEGDDHHWEPLQPQRRVGLWEVGGVAFERQLLEFDGHEVAHVEDQQEVKGYAHGGEQYGGTAALWCTRDWRSKALNIMI